MVVLVLRSGCRHSSLGARDSGVERGQGCVLCLLCGSLMAGCVVNEYKHKGTFRRWWIKCGNYLVCNEPNIVAAAAHVILGSSVAPLT